MNHPLLEFVLFPLKIFLEDYNLTKRGQFFVYLICLLYIPEVEVCFFEHIIAFTK
jgi:hypothetical protein